MIKMTNNNVIVGGLIPGLTSDLPMVKNPKNRGSGLGTGIID